MQTETEIRADISHPVTQTVPAMQHDSNTRVVTIALYDAGEIWQPPEDVSIAIGYEKPDRTRGLYDKLPDGTNAITRAGNVLSVVLVQQMLSVPGTVRACVVFNDAQLNQLTTFPFQVQVEVNPAVDAPQSENYQRLQWLEDKLTEYLTLAKESGEFTGPIGPGPVMLGQEVAFQVSRDYQQIPTGVWHSQIPSMAQKEYLWSRTTVHYDSGDVVLYGVSRNGADGMGAVVSVCGVTADDMGNIPLTAENVGALPCAGGKVLGTLDMDGQKLTGLPAPAADSDAANRAFVVEQAVAAQNAARNAVKTRIVSFLLNPGDWAGDNAPYTLFVPLTDEDADRNLRVHPLFHGDAALDLPIREACNAVSYAIRSAEGITFTCLEEKPGTAIPVSAELYL